jgi:type II secretory pathway pseudopilin PulG
MELILVMAIIGILSVIGIGSFTQTSLKSRDTQRKNDLNQIAKALELYYNDTGSYPESDGGGTLMCRTPQVGTTCNEPNVCTTKFTYCFGGKSTTYMDKLPVDSIAGRKYFYKPDASLSNFALYAAMENSEDRDIVVTSGTTVKTNWDSDSVDCGTSTSVPCNYKITETGLVRSK